MEVRRGMVRLLFILLFSGSVCYGQANRFAGFGYKNTCDVDAQKFIDSAGITNASQKSAICSYITMLKDSLLWGKIYAGYIFIGGSASTTKFNIKDIRSDTSAYTLTYSGGWLYSNFGALANGINATANTWLRPSVKLTIRNYSIALYVNGGTLTGGAAPATVYTMSDGGDFNNSANGITLRTTIKYFAPNGEGNPVVLVSNNSLTGIYLANVSGSTARIYKDGLSIGSNTTSGGFLSIQPFFIGGTNVSGLHYQNVQIGCLIIASGLTDAEAKTMSNIISIFKNTLGI